MIRVKEVAVIDPDGKQLGTFPTFEAISMAQEQNMDLVEVSPNANPPVCRIMDYGKFKYKQNKRAHEAKKNQKVIHVKEVKFRPNTDQHDFDFKIKHLLRFLEAGDKAKVVIFFKGREIVHQENGERILERVVKAVEDYGTVEQSSKREGRTLTMILVPKAKKKEPKKAENTEESES
ncbi:MAG: translation initiation factor IF-3 [Nitrospinaceae bacterium]|nr:translation initiation factor IF-3 [Nitrospinaceae bacterium]NIR56790.1 translation initiation factor IF-3 [Nitrospinaceae bacterium]NIS87246.1 translation initiation factor IF-3 [Nitrospinaceae bacterium]NIT82400.1 translation initiation factor IF-3 [Nitrospinaceae bacterium]NIU44613.1 translation initiation factor IF-3 [Nitrospinaceae bacterium]